MARSQLDKRHTVAERAGYFALRSLTPGPSWLERGYAKMPTRRPPFQAGVTPPSRGQFPPAGRVAGVQSLSIEQVAPPYEVAQALESPVGAKVGRISRVRLVDGMPLALASEYLPLSAAISFERLASFSGGSLYEFLTQDLGLTLLRSEMSVTAVSATAQQAKDLDIKRGAPLLLMREVHFGEGDRRILYSINHHNSAVIDLTLMRVGVRA